MLPKTRRSPGWSLLLTSTLLLGHSALTVADENASADTTGQSQPGMSQPGMSQEATDSVPASMGNVARAVFTTQIADREPVDTVTELTNDKERVYFFTDLRGMTGQIITHQWEFAGNIMAEVKFKVGSGPRWRVYSSKNLLPDWVGEWTVKVIDESGSTLNVSQFRYLPASTDNTTSNDPQKN